MSAKHLDLMKKVVLFILNDGQIMRFVQFQRPRRIFRISIHEDVCSFQKIGSLDKIQFSAIFFAVL